jgi:hypothetical protein
MSNRNFISNRPGFFVQWNWDRAKMIDLFVIWSEDYSEKLVIRRVLGAVTLQKMEAYDRRRAKNGCWRNGVNLRTVMCTDGADFQRTYSRRSSMFWESKLLARLS